MSITHSRRRKLLWPAEPNAAIGPLIAYVTQLKPGDRIPTHTKLMRLLNVPERAILSALGTLQEDGIIVRINGKGTFVAETEPGDPPSQPGE